MKKCFLITMSMLLMGACSSLPTGDKQLSEIFSADQRQLVQDPVAVNKGEPIFIRSWMYPTIYSTGDIRKGSEIFVFVGRKSFSVTDLLEEPR